MTHASTFLVAGLLHLTLGVLALVLGRGRAQTLLLSAAFIVQALWAVSAVVGHPVAAAATGHLDFARAIVWALFFGSLLAGGRWGRVYLVPAGIAAAYAAVIAAMHVTGVALWPLVVALSTVAAILVLAFISAILRNSDEDDRWRLKLLCFPLAALFTYDLFIHAQALGFGDWRPELVQVKGLLNVVAVPFLLVGTLRARLGRRRLAISHRGALYSTVFMVSGVYLLAVAGAAMAIGWLAAPWRLPLQVAFLFAAIMALVTALSSGAVRAGLKTFLGDNFFAHKYDYRHEWQRLLATLSDDDSGIPLETRLVRAIADLVEAPGGALYGLDRDVPRLLAGWNFRLTDPVRLTASDFGPSDRPGPIKTPIEGVWLAVPLPTPRAVVGFVVLPPPRAPRPIDAEDRTLIMMVAQHCAEQLSALHQTRAFAENQQFERFSRQYAFVVHDIKNVVSQLALLLKNFERHKTNPEFQADMKDTVAHAVARLDRLTARIHALKSGMDRDDLAVSPLADVLAEQVDALNAGAPGSAVLRIDEAAKALQARLPLDRFSAVINHLIANAREAMAEAQPVLVDLSTEQRFAVIDIVDHGPGMSPAFIDNELFKPFRSTKANGFGLGAYQCRAFARDLGGELEALSAPGAGTTMRLRLPLTQPDRRDAALEAVS